MHSTLTVTGTSAHFTAAEVGRLACRRSVRVGCLLAACLAMGFADLIMTLTHATTIGFAEANPIARALMDSGSAGPITLWKLSSMAIATGLLIAARKTRTGELGAWLSVAILVWLMFRWSTYNDHIQMLTAELAHGTPTSNVCWVQMR
ncbi:MAG TPA: DUF5658 family protein [Phycisphaerales bacterium]|nr:DUF5658 family protein [Phycisphaerales bacterium]